MRRSLAVLAALSLVSGLLFVVTGPAAAQVPPGPGVNEIDKSAQAGGDSQFVAPGGTASFTIETGRLEHPFGLVFPQRQYRVFDPLAPACGAGPIQLAASPTPGTSAGFGSYNCGVPGVGASFTNTAILQSRTQVFGPNEDQCGTDPRGRPRTCWHWPSGWRPVDSDTSEVVVRVSEARLNVVKNAEPEDDDPFDFVVRPLPAGAPRNFTLTDPSLNRWGRTVAPGRYRVGEDLGNLPGPRWFYESGECVNRPTGESLDIGPDARIDLEIGPGDDWTCTFYNKEYAQIQFGKIALTEHPLTDPDATFEFLFDVDGFVEFHSLQDGDTVLYDRVRAGGTEVAIEYLLPPRWRVKDIYCEDGAGAWDAFIIDPELGLLVIYPDWGDEYVCWFVDEEIFLSVEKLVNGHDADTMPGPTFLVGEPLTYKFVVTNHGPTPATNIAVNDNKLGPIACPKTVLEPGESMTCTVESVVMPGEHKNVATVTGWSDGEELYDDDPAHYVGEQGDFDLKIVKRGPRFAAPNSWVTYEYFVWNQLPGTAVVPTVTDDKCAPVEYHSGDWNNDGLAQFGEAWKFTCDYYVDSPPFTMIVNIATVHPTDGDFDPDDNQAWWWMPVVPWMMAWPGTTF